MASSYPTPPPTNSPKYAAFQLHHYDPLAPEADPIYPYVDGHPLNSKPITAQTQDSYFQPPPSSYVDGHPLGAKSHISAQDSYSQHPSSPLIPGAFQQSSNVHESTYTQESTLVQEASYVHSSQQQQQQQPPPRRRSSPQPPRPYSPRLASINRASTPPRRYTPSGANPNYYTSSPLPTSPKPTPYSLNRPQPRPGFLRRIALKIESWLRAFMRWSKRHPIFAGVLTFAPLLAFAGVTKAVRAVGKGLGFMAASSASSTSTTTRSTQRNTINNSNKSSAESGLLDAFVEFGGSEEGRRVESETWTKTIRKDGSRGSESGGLKGIFDAFISFGGTKGGPLEGILKILQMLM